MTITLNLPPDVEARLSDEAADAGMTVEEYALSRLAGPFSDSKPQTGAELAAALQALPIPSCFADSSIDSVELARELRKQAETRVWS